MSVVDFYDGFAPVYHLVYGDGWEGAVERHGAALARLIAAARPDAGDVLDCSCGIGTQAIGLARRGYRVTGTDVSAGAAERARVEAARLGAEVSFGVADFRALDAVAGEFDVVLSYDNAVPHLLDDADVVAALRSMRSKLRPDGLLLVGIRDYDEALATRPATMPPRLVDGPPRRLIARFHDCDAPPSPRRTVHFFVLTETGSGRPERDGRRRGRPPRKRLWTKRCTSGTGSDPRLRASAGTAPTSGRRSARRAAAA